MLCSPAEHGWGHLPFHVKSFRKFKPLGLDTFANKPKITMHHKSHARMTMHFYRTLQFSSVQSLSRVRLFAIPWIAARQASLSITNSWSSLKLKSVKSVMPFSHLIFCCPLFLLPPIPPRIRVFSNESALCMRWPKYWIFSFSINLPKKSQGWSPSEWTGWISLKYKGLSRVFSNTTVQKHQFFGTQPSSQFNSHIHTWPQEKP